MRSFNCINLEQYYWRSPKKDVPLLGNQYFLHRRKFFCNDIFIEELHK